MSKNDDAYKNCPDCGGFGYVRPDGTHYISARQRAQARRRGLSAAAAAVECDTCHCVGAVRV